VGTQPILANKVAFGPFEYDDPSGQLTKSGTPIRLQGKPLQILLFLLNRAGQVVSREELQRHLWEGTTFVDFEQGLNSAVNKLRQTLGDSADQARYVETLPGRGYRFIAPVLRTANSAVLEMSSPSTLRIEPKPPAPRRPWRPILLAVALVIAVVGGFWLALRFTRSVEAPKVVKLTVSPPAGFALEGAASRQGFALSPDGSPGVHGDGFRRGIQCIRSRFQFVGTAFNPR
jgi:DNA-binding winged helix-turn-helix (wHTH) protein